MSRPAACLLAICLLLVVVGDAAADPPDAPTVDFLRDVMPALSKAGCNGGGCHGSFQGRGGFRLSLFGFDAAFDYDALVKEGRGRRLVPAAPMRSLALLKPLGRVPHGGGRRFEQGDALGRVLETWIAEGTRPPADWKLRVERIEVSPAEAVLQPGESANVRVTAHWSDGASRDVSHLAHYQCRDEQRASVTPAGTVRAESAGRTAVTVTFMGQVGVVQVTVPYAETVGEIDFPEQNPIDRLVKAEWHKLGLRPAELSSDHEFIRRVYLDVIGTLPTVEEVRAFAALDDPRKRERLIDALLERPEYVDYWSMRWADLLRVHRRYVGDKGLWSFWGWVRQGVRENKPLDELTRELLTSRGSLYANGATAFYYVDATPEELAETTAQLFLGVRLQCARCHHHPYEAISQEDYFGLANFFTRIELKDNGDGGRYGGAKLLRPVQHVPKDRRPKQSVEPAAFGHATDPEATDDVRRELAAGITAPENPYFARNFANRYWSYFMGRGLVEPVDDLRATNPPSHPELLDALADELVKSGYDVKHLIRLICTSRVYQLASEVAPRRDADGMFYTHQPYRRLGAAVLLDAVNRVCGTVENFDGLPAGTRALALPDPQVQSYFLDAFGRSVRSSPCECAVSTEPDLAQALHLINGANIDGKLRAGGGRLAKLLETQSDDAAVIEELYLAAFARPPSREELATAAGFIAEAPSRREGFEDLLWTLLNATEFVFNH